MDDDRPSSPESGTNITANSEKPENGGWLAKLKRLVGFGRADTSLRESLEDVLEQHAGDGDGEPVRADARSMMLNLLEFSGLRVDDVMVARAEIIAIEENSSVAEMLECFLSAGHSRLPVYRETPDHPIGMVHIKDFLAWLSKTGRGVAKPKKTSQKAAGGLKPLNLSASNLRTAIKSTGTMRELLFVPPSMPAADLLVKMQSTHIHMAIVVDEYGGTDGLATIEDLVEEIVGDIADEHDEDDELIRAVDENVWMADARIEIDDLEEMLKIDMLPDAEEEEADTLGGLIFFMLGRVPVRGEIVRHSSGVEFEIMDADPRRVRRVRIHTRPRQRGRSTAAKGAASTNQQDA